MTKSLTISKNIPERKDLQYSFLRETGRSYIESLAHRLWTDYNTHDPGITILEMLAYSITDLGYRLSFPIKDIVSYPSETEVQTSPPPAWKMHHQFLSALHALPACPLTALDYRKLFIDIEGVRNAWLFKNSDKEHKLWIDCKESKFQYDPPVAGRPSIEVSLNGFYDVKIELETGAVLEEVKERVRQRYHHHRNLCEDLATVEEVKEAKLVLCADIEIEPRADALEIYVQVLYRVQQYLTPPYSFYSLQEMLGKGIASGEIFEGPVLEHGFLVRDEIKNADLRKVIRYSDLVRIIMGIKGVKTIRKLVIDFLGAPLKEEPSSGCLHVPEGRKPVILADESPIRFFKDILQVKADKINAVKQLEDLLSEDTRKKYEKKTEDLPIPKGEFPEGIGEYSTFQNQFPLTYGVTRHGIPGKVITERSSQAKQLKAYLLFFDQVLANYFAQLEGVKHLLAADDGVKKTYFSQVVGDLAGMDDILPPSSVSKLDQITGVIENYHQRKNQLLDHLIARFAESFNDYVLLMHTIYHGSLEDEIISDKVRFLREYSQISCRRASAYDYYNNDAGVWDTDNVSGLERRIARLSGIDDYKRRDLPAIKYEIYNEKDDDGIDEFRFRVFEEETGKVILSSSENQPTVEKAEEQMWESVMAGQKIDNYKIFQSEVNKKFYFSVLNDREEIIATRKEGFATSELAMKAVSRLLIYLARKTEGMYLVEHMLLRPVKGIHGKFFTVCTEKDCTYCDPLDPYSFRITVVLPGWYGRFADMDFRVFLERLIRKEAPAHILVKICWIGSDQMKEFIPKYRLWLEKKKEGKGIVPEPVQEPFLTILEELKTIYPAGTLHDCKDDVEDNPIILSRTRLGNL